MFGTYLGAGAELYCSVPASVTLAFCLLGGEHTAYRFTERACLEEVHFIDYEYGAVNYQLFDIANHFCEYAGKYTDRNRQSAIWIITGVEDLDYSRCPSDQEKRNFLRTYLEYFHERKPEDLEVEHALRQIPFFEAVSTVARDVRMATNDAYCNIPINITVKLTAALFRTVLQ